jgi:hypothetical protein
MDLIGARRFALGGGASMCICVLALLWLSTAAWATAPVVESESVESVGYTVATLRARINQGEEPTSYHFEYGPSESYGTSVPADDESIGSSPNETEVSQAITGMSPGSVYHYRVAATNASGTIYGVDHAFETFPASSIGAEETCPNAVFRVGGLSAGLPDCRAYEMVSPPDKNGADVTGQLATNMVALSGNAIAFASHNGFANTVGSGAVGLNQYVAFRGADAWSTYAVTPTPVPVALQLSITATRNWIFSPELDRSVVEGYDFPGAEGSIPNSQDLYVEDVRSRHLETVTAAPGAELTNPFALYDSLRGVSADLGVVAFQTRANLLESTLGSSQKLYAMDHGSLRLVGILPDGSVPTGGSTSANGPGGGGAGLDQALELQHQYGGVSADGSRIFFMSPGSTSSPSQLYVREDEERTRWISQSEASAPNPAPEDVKFQEATPDGREVVFSTTDVLLDADPGGPGYALYLYRDGPDPEAEPNLTFIGRFTGSAEPRVLAVSTDAKRIYFTTGEENPAEPSSLGLDVWNEGQTYVVTDRFHFGDVTNEGLTSGQVDISEDGQRFAFADVAHGTLPTGQAGPPESIELYVYDAPQRALTCASCPSNGASVTANVESDPHATAAGVGFPIVLHHKFITSDGDYVFFSTEQGLVPQDTNGLTDVYEYDMRAHRAALVSSGSGDQGTWFVGTSASGRDVFFVTRQSYSRWDIDTLADLYDARVDGGLPEPPQPAPPCAGDACQGVPAAAPTFNTASGFSGLGNITPSVVNHKKTRLKRKHPPGRHKSHRHRKPSTRRRAPRRAGR